VSGGTPGVGRARAAAVVAALIAAPLSLAGCVPAIPKTEMVAAVSAGVLAASPEVRDVLVTANDQVAGYSVWVQAYVDPGTTPDAIVEMLDAVIPATIASAPVRPASLRFTVDAAPKNEGDRIGSGRLIDLEIAKALGLGGLYRNSLIGGTGSEFEAIYGTWDELHG